MVYRTHARQLEHVEDAHDIQVVADETRKRKRRAAVFVSAMTLCVAVMPFVYAAARGPTVTTKCHSVMLQYENAPEIPPNVWRVCRDVTLR